MPKVSRNATLLAYLMLTACTPQKQAVISDAQWQKATAEVEQRYGQDVQDRLTPYFLAANLHYPPKKIALLTFKEKKQMELWASENNTNWQHIRNYPLTAYSGNKGPKLKRNDGQIPEGIYQITHFNPFSSQHLSLMLNYPNSFDKIQAKTDGRYDLGDNIFIHGKEKSVGCLAIGDRAIDDIFVLVKKVGKENTTVIIAPQDFRVKKNINFAKTAPKWLPTLYQRLKAELNLFT